MDRWKLGKSRAEIYYSLVPGFLGVKGGGEISDFGKKYVQLSYCGVKKYYA